MPDNGGYATAAYIVAAIVYVSYAISIRVRATTLRERLRDVSKRTGEPR
ncbi:MAG: hypothetical protein ABI625_16145 [bacterium]